MKFWLEKIIFRLKRNVQKSKVNNIMPKAASDVIIEDTVSKKMIFSPRRKKQEISKLFPSIRSKLPVTQAPSGEGTAIVLPQSITYHT